MDVHIIIIIVVAVQYSTLRYFVDLRKHVWDSRVGIYHKLRV